MFNLIRLTNTCDNYDTKQMRYVWGTNLDLNLFVHTKIRQMITEVITEVYSGNSV